MGREVDADPAHTLVAPEGTKDLSGVIALLFGLGLAPADSITATIASRVVLDIAAPASLVWSFLPSIRKRPNMEKVSLNGLTDQFGARFDTIFKDNAGKVTRHDRIEVLHWEPGVRYVALVTYLPPAEPVTIVSNVDLKESGGITHFRDGFLLHRHAQSRRHRVRTIRPSRPRSSGPRSPSGGPRAHRRRHGASQIHKKN